MRIIALPLTILLLASACKQTPPPQGDDAVATAQFNAGMINDKRRVLDLEGGVNFRDIGGYRTTEGDQVKWATVYRAGSPAGLTPADTAKLRKLGIRTVCDFRSNEERGSEPSPLIAEDSQIEYLTRDYRSTTNSGDLEKMLMGPDASPEKSRKAMAELYKTMPEQFAENYRAMFRSLADGNTPLVFNCTAGKDRTGVAAALILTALGVPRETIVADYALSDKVVDYRAQLAGNADKTPEFSSLSKLPWETVEPLLASHPSYIEATLDALAAKYGSVDNFIEQRLEVTPAMRDQIRAHLLQPPSQ